MDTTLEHAPLGGARLPASLYAHGAAFLAYRVLFALVALVRRTLSRVGLCPASLLALERELWRRVRTHLARFQRVPPPVDTDVEESEVVTRVPGAELAGTLFLPSAAYRARHGGRVPGVVIRSPYDRRSPLLGPGLARFFAERGFAALLQDCRGRFGSGGDFFPVANEVRDGGATVEWLAKQDYCNGKVGAWGISYLGLTAYGCCGGAGARTCRAVVPIMACSRLYPVLFHDGSTLALDLIMRWLWLVLDVMHSRPLAALSKFVNHARHLTDALHPSARVSIADRDRLLLGERFLFFQDVVRAHRPTHEFWADKDVLCDLSNPDTSPALSIVAGWHDFFVTQAFRDFQAAASVETRLPLELTVGKWSHWDLSYASMGFTKGLQLFERVLREEDPGERGEEAARGTRPTRINVFVLHSECLTRGGEGVWRSFDAWPPRDTTPTKLALGARGAIATPGAGQGSAASVGFSEHRYDPHEPTPHAGGPSFDWTNSGRVEQSVVESRPDVLVFSSQPLADDLVCIGEVALDLALWSDNPHIDVFCKLCDVDAEGRSWNVLERLTRLEPENFAAPSGEDDGGFSVRLAISLGPTAVCFARGHRVRLQVSGGAHPVYLRHHGTDDHLATATSLRRSVRRVWHDAASGRASALSLPVVPLKAGESAAAGL